MQEYDYQLIDREGRLVKGRAEAASTQDLAGRLNAEGHTVVDISERRPAEQSWFRSSPSPQEQVTTFHELATLLESGVSLRDAVEAQASSSHHPQLASGFRSISGALMRGENLREAVGNSRLKLPSYVYQLIEAGELSGQLAQALRQAVNQMQYDQRVAADMRGALLYPSILVVSGCLAILVVFIFVIPQFSSLLRDGADLPFLAQAVLGTGIWFGDNLSLAAGLLAAAAVCIAVLSRQQRVRQTVRDSLSRLPVLGAWFAETDTAKWASLMSAMLTSRVTLLDALKLAAQGVQISRRRELLEQATADVRGGASLPVALEKHRALTPTGYNLLKVGEQSGRLAETMEALARLHEDNSRRRMKRFLALVEPLAVLVVGGFLGLIMIGIILAISGANDIAI